MLLSPAHSIPLLICSTISRVSHSVNGYTILQVLRYSSSLLTPLLRLSHTFQVSQCFLTIDSLSLFFHCSQLFLIALSHFHFLTRANIVSTIDNRFISHFLFNLSHTHTLLNPDSHLLTYYWLLLQSLSFHQLQLQFNQQFQHSYRSVKSYNSSTKLQFFNLLSFTDNNILHKVR